MGEKKKYELTDIRNNNLYRIRALRYIPQYGVKPGDLGGWIKSENNLSQDGNCWVGDNAMISGNARVEENAHVFGNALVFGNAIVCGDANVNENAWVDEDARVSGKVRICGNVWVYGNAQVSGDAWVHGNAHISRNGFVSSTQDLLLVGPIGSRKACTTFYRAVGGIWVCCGCFNGSINKFETAVKKKHGDNQTARVYLAAIELAKIQIEF